jgi:hypothetical protein
VTGTVTFTITFTVKFSVKGKNVKAKIMVKVTVLVKRHLKCNDTRNAIFLTGGKDNNGNGRCNAIFGFGKKINNIK